MATPTKIAAARASERLTQSLINLAARGLHTHCSYPETSYLWLSEHPAERADATQLCHGCPVIMECWAASVARDERWGVWAGIDRSPNRSAAA
jgi:Transcription factor WhiB